MTHPYNVTIRHRTVILLFNVEQTFNKNSDDHEFTDTSQNRNKIVLKKFKFVNRKGKKNLKTQAK